MTGREKIFAAFSPDGTPEFPVVICYTGIFIRDHWDELTSCPWWYRHETDLEHQLAWHREVIEKTDLDWFFLPSFYSREKRKHLSIELSGSSVYLFNELTREKEELRQPAVAGWNREGKVQSIRPEVMANTADEVDSLIVLPPVRVGPGDEGESDLAHLLLEEFGGERFPMDSVSSPLWKCYSIWGFEGMMTMAVDRPDLVRRACSRFLENALCSVEKSAALGAEGIWIEECLTDMISPAAYETLNLPYLQILTERIRDLGLKSVYYFCGNPGGKWDLIFQTGADALSLEESKKGFTIDLEEVVRKNGGRFALLGNLDAVGILQDASDNALEAEISRQTHLGRRNGGRFILSLGSPVTPGTPLKRVQTYVRMARESAIAKKEEYP